MKSGSESVPRWDLSPIYKSFDDPAWARDLKRMSEAAAELLDILDTALPADGRLAETAARAVALFEEAGDLQENLSAWAHAVYTTDTSCAVALERINELEEKALPLRKAEVLVSTRLAERSKEIESILIVPPASTVSAGTKGGDARQDPVAFLQERAFFLREEIRLAKHRMPVEMEDLANDLARSGIDAWSRLQEAVTSKLAVPYIDPLTGKTETKTVTELRTLAFSPDRTVRKAAFDAETSAWKSMEIPLAAALNGVKGCDGTLDARRGWKDPIEKSAIQSRLSQKALDALITSLEESLPLFRRYLTAKARDMGLECCAFWDLFAPVGGSETRWTWEASRKLIEEVSRRFDPAMGDFVAAAFDKQWIDAELRSGKVGGAYCTSFPVQGDSRILCNWEASFSSVSTIAHELGHAWHHELIRHKPRSLRSYPMILAETASIFSETLLFESFFQEAPPHEKHALLEGNLQDACQVIVDILSRFYFEREVYARRSGKELQAEELCQIMAEAQRATYGDGLDSEALHPYMWAAKVHYYIPGLSFYNYPYAFGQLFALALYAQFAEGADADSSADADSGAALARFRSLLENSGSMDAVDLARDAGVDLEDPAFWRAGIAVIARRVDEYEQMAGGSTQSARPNKTEVQA